MKINFGKIKKAIKMILNAFWQELSLVLILFVVMIFLIGGIFFYVYYLKIIDKEPVTPLLLSVNQVLLDSIFSKWDEKEIKFNKAIVGEFPNFFKDIPTLESTSTEEISISSEEVLE